MNEVYLDEVDWLLAHPPVFQKMRPVHDADGWLLGYEPEQQGRDDQYPQQQTNDRQ